MLSNRSLFAISSCILLLLILFVNARQPTVSKKSKLCGNVNCDEVLFKTRVKRVMGINNDPNFLKLFDGAIIDVTSVKFSDRYDIMEGRIGDSRGFFYAGAIDVAPYAEFLRTAIVDKKEMQIISQDPSDIGEKKIIGVVHSETDLVRDYNAKAVDVARELGLPPPELFEIPEPKDDSGHGHSHGGHGHSHGGHGHSHDKPAETVKPAEPVKVIAEPVVVTTTPAPVAAQEAQPVINLNNVLGTPPTTGEAAAIEDAMEKFIREDEERQKRQAELKTEPVVAVAEATPDVAATEVPEVVPAPTTPAPIETIELPITTPAPVVEDVPVPVQEVTPAPIETIVEVTPAPEEVITPQSVAEIPPPPVQDIVTQPPVIIEQPVEVTPAPIEVVPEVVTTPQPPLDIVLPEITLPVEEVVAPKEELNTQPPPPPPPPAPIQEEPVVQVTQQQQSQEDADFAKWEAERAAASKPIEERTNYSHQDIGVPPTSSGLIEFIRSTFALGNITDASIAFYVNITFVLASLVIYLVIHTLSSSSEPDKFDRLAYFNLTTKHKELELKLKAAEAKVGAGIQQVAAPQNDQELIALRHQHSQLASELQLVQSQRAEFEHHMNQWKVSSDEKQQEIERLVGVVAEFEQKLERTSYGGQETARELDSIRAQLNESQQIVLLRQQELNDLKYEKDEYQQKYEQELENLRKIQLRIDEVQQINNDLESELKHAKTENSSLMEVIQQYEKNQNEGGSAGAESGGSGWSDFGDNDDEIEENKKEEKTPESSQIEIVRSNIEIVELNKRIVDLEKEYVKYRALYEKEERLKIERENNSKNSEKKIEELEAEKKESAERMNEMLKMLNQSMNKSSEVDKIISTLREEGFAKDKQLLENDVTTRKKDDKIREIESELKRLQKEYTKLETKSFHDVMQLKKKLDDLQTTQILGGLANSSAIIAGGGADFGGGIIGGIGGQERLGSPLDNPIWDEPVYPPQGGRQQMLGQQEDYFSSGSMTLPTKKRTSRRSAMGEQLETTNEKSSGTKSKKEHSGNVAGSGGAAGSSSTHRRRSRSHGRQSQVYNDPFAPVMSYGSSDSSFMSHQAPGFAPLTGRHSKSGHLHYSSGGSNGGRSPPPEMPLLSAIPPPGVRKPPSKRLG